jgi:hypothetical protein
MGAIHKDGEGVHRARTVTPGPRPASRLRILRGHHGSTPPKGHQSRTGHHRHNKSSVTFTSEAQPAASASVSKKLTQSTHAKNRGNMVSKRGWTPRQFQSNFSDMQATQAQETGRKRPQSTAELSAHYGFAIVTNRVRPSSATQPLDHLLRSR